jgi:peroxidase
LIAEGLKYQFTRTRDGDRYWYRNDADLSADDIAWLESVQLSDLIRWNTSITNVQENVFFMAVPEPSSMAILVALTLVIAIFERRPRACSRFHCDLFTA